MTIREKIEGVRRDIYVECRGKNSYRACHDGISWFEFAPTFKIAAARVRYWRICALTSRCGCQLSEWTYRAWELVDEGGPWTSIARKIIKEVKNAKA